MRLFWWGIVAGWLAFVPSVLLVWWAVSALAEWAERPHIAFGDNRVLYRWRRTDDMPRILAFLRQEGFDYKHLGGTWYWVWRVGHGKKKLL